MAGDSIRLTAVVKDAQGNTVPNARVRWFGGVTLKSPRAITKFVLAGAFVCDPYFPAIGAIVRGATSLGYAFGRS